MVLPDGERITGLSAAQYVFDGVDHRFRLMLRSIYLFLKPPHISPFDCGLMDFPNDYYEAFSAFTDGGKIYAENNKNTRAILKQLGAK